MNCKELKLLKREAMLKKDNVAKRAINAVLNNLARTGAKEDDISSTTVINTIKKEIVIYKESHGDYKEEILFLQGLLPPELSPKKIIEILAVNNVTDFKEAFIILDKEYKNQYNKKIVSDFIRTRK